MDQPPALQLHGWADRAVIGVALAALAAGFGQFGLVAALGDVARDFGQQVHGASIADQVGLSGTELGVGLAIIRLASLGSLPFIGAADRIGRRTMLLGTLTPGPGHDRGLGPEPGLLVVRGDLRLWAATAQRHQRPGAGGGGRTDRHPGPGLGRGAHRGGLRGRGRTHRHHRQPGLRLPRVPWDVSCWPSSRWLSCHCSGGGSRSPIASPWRRHARTTRCPSWAPVGPRFRRRLAVVALLGAAIGVITGPANSFVFLYAQNVLHQPGYVTAAMVVGAGVAGLGGLLVGRWLADHLGRRPTGALAMVGLAGFGTLAYAGSRPALVIGYIMGVLAGSIIAPPLGSLLAELFPTSVRASVAGWWVAAGVIGAGVGLVAFGAVADAGDRFGRAAVLTFLPTALAAGLFWLVPETRGREPEDLWPSAPTASGPDGSL